MYDVNSRTLYIANSYPVIYYILNFTRRDIRLHSCVPHAHTAFLLSVFVFAFHFPFLLTLLSCRVYWIHCVINNPMINYLPLDTSGITTLST